jgi:diguanylate cyclase (GGDEF)-like protein
MAEALDPLTGLRSRSAFHTALQQCIDEAEGVALALLDLDYFKQINDTLGHAAGDEVLQQVGQMLAAAVPGYGFRLGGDEFALMMPGATLEQAFLRMEALRAQVAAAGLPRAGALPGLTVTIGVAQHPRDAKDSRELLTAADTALASAKDAGRNQVCLTPNEKMVMKSCYYPSSSLEKLRALARSSGRKEASLLREALDDLLRRYDAPVSGGGA